MWSNGLSPPTLVRLDQTFSTISLDEQHTVALLRRLLTVISDHTPIPLDTIPSILPQLCFHFKWFWSSIEGFDDVVKCAWSSDVGEHNPFMRIFKTKITVRQLISWSNKRVRHVKLKLATPFKLISSFHKAPKLPPLSGDELWLWHNLKRSYLGLACLDRNLVSNHSHIRWLREGDANTDFFYHMPHCRQ